MRQTNNQIERKQEGYRGKGTVGERERELERE